MAAPFNSTGKAFGAHPENFSGATNLLAIGPNAGTNAKKIPCSGIYPDGEVVITNCNGDEVTLHAGPSYYGVQAIAIISGTGVVVW